jgi:hypothetical protein
MRFENLLAASRRTWCIRLRKALLVPCCNQEAARLHQRSARRRVPNRVASFFETIRLPSLSGRPISDSDDSKAAGVVVINERAAHEYWPGQSLIGQRIVIGDKIGQRPEQSSEGP